MDGHGRPCPPFGLFTVLKLSFLDSQPSQPNSPRQQNPPRQLNTPGGVLDDLSQSPIGSPMVTRQNDQIQLTLPKKKQKKKDERADKYKPILAPMTLMSADDIKTHMNHAREYF